METTVNKNTRHQKLSTRYRIFLLEQFSKYRKEIFMLYVEKLSINIKLKFKNTCDIRILLQSHEFSRLIKTSRYCREIFKKNPQHFETIFYPFHTKFSTCIHVINVAIELVDPYVLFVEITVKYFDKIE